MIEVSGLTKLYGDFVAVNELSFTVRPGEVLGLVGPNGAGKTTTLRSLSGIIQPSKGTVRIAEHDLATDPLAAKRALAVFPDEPRLFDYLTVWQHLNFTARVYQVADWEATADRLLREFQMDDKRGQLPAELSRGMKQKVELACGLLHAPKALLFDEPLTGLDPAGCRLMKQTVVRLAREGASVIISSHLLHVIEEICTHLLILQNGREVAQGTLEAIHERFAGGDEVSLEEVFFRATEPGSPPP
jgi:ABC-2 type transport system ATP-binding protein